MDIHDDDKPVGRILSRREILKLIGGSSTVAFLGFSFPNIISAQTPTSTPLPNCIVKPELTEGPYFVANELNRFDIRIEPSDDSLRIGTPLYLIFQISDVTQGQCKPLEDAQVDVWHCDADGTYSGVEDPGFDNEGEMWLRGFQVTDDTGRAEFLTIVPGWYSGRAVHIHFKVRVLSLDGESYEFTSQLFFDAEQIEEIYTQEPYTAHGLPDTPNETDFIYRDSEDLLTITMNPMEESDFENLNEKLETIDFDSGLVAVFDLGLDLSDSAVGASDSMNQGRERR